MKHSLRYSLMAILQLSTLACSKMDFVAADLESRKESLNQGTILISGGEAYTKTSTVSLKLQATAAEQMLVTNDPSCQSGGEWEPFQQTRTWDLMQLNAEAQVFVKFRQGTIESECFSDSIIHDDIAPIVQVTAPPAKFLTGAILDMPFSFSEAGSGLANAVCSKNGTAFACSDRGVVKLDAIQAQADYRLNTYTFEFSATDRAGNTSNSVVVRFKILPITTLRTLTQSVTTSSQAPDVLFVADSSKGTMNYQANRDFHEGFGALSDSLAGLNWQAALITANATPSTEVNQMQDGKLIPIVGISSPTHILSALMTDASTLFANTMSYIFTNQDSYKPQALESAKRAMDRSASEPAKSFFRADSHLAFVIYSDQDEYLSASETPQAKANQFVDHVRMRFGASKQFSVYSIVRPEGDTECRKDGNKPGLTYDLLARQTGGLVQTICAPDFSAVMTQIGRTISEKILNLSLGCQPYFDPEEMSAAVSILKDGSTTNLSYTLNGSLLRLQEPLTVGQYQFRFSCIQP